MIRGWVAFLAAAPLLFSQASSQWVHAGPGGKLQYKTDVRGNRIIDFSDAGYGGGGVALPLVPVRVRVDPAAGDSTARIQAAIDTAARQTPAAVLLRAGVYEVTGTVTISTSGVVLRGEPGAVIRLTGAPHRFLEIRGSGTWQPDGDTAPIIDDYVPSGSYTVTAPAARVQPGDTVLVQRPVTAEWIHFMGMDTLVRDGKPQTWIKAGSIIRTDRKVKSLAAGGRVTLDAPLSDALDAAYGRASIVRYRYPGRIREVGIESLRVEAPFDDAPITDAQFTFLRMDAVEDAWVRDVEVRETQNGVVIGPGAKRVTMTGVRVIHSAAHSGSAAPADFALQGTQILLDRCSVEGEGTWPFVTQAQVTGPIVILNASAVHNGGVAPHQRWATGLLVDHSRFADTTERKPGIAFTNRSTMGSGHGWDVGWAVAWNVESPFLVVQQPPGAINWCIGCTGKQGTSREKAGEWDSPNRPVTPESLYLAQLRERLGEAAIRNIGYR